MRCGVSAWLRRMRRDSVARRVARVLRLLAAPLLVLREKRTFNSPMRACAREAKVHAVHGQLITKHAQHKQPRGFVAQQTRNSTRNSATHST